ncbi:MAG: hypothetical protein ACTS2F_00230 [Thainema sp.]
MNRCRESCQSLRSQIYTDVLSCEIPATVSPNTLKQFASYLGSPTLKRHFLARWINGR